MMSMSPDIIQKIPAELIQALGKQLEIINQIETGNLEIYETKTENGKVFVNI